MGVPDVSGVWQQLAAQLLPGGSANKDEVEQEIERLRARLPESPRDPDLYLALSHAYRRLEAYQDALEILRAGVATCRRQPDLHHQYLTLLQQTGRTSEMLQAAADAVRLLPWDVPLRLRNALLLPILYDDEAEIEFFHQRFAAGLKDLTERLPLDTFEAVGRARDAIGCDTPFYLPYLGLDVGPLLIGYGAFVDRIMQASCPAPASPQPGPVPVPGERLRVGFVSSCFHSHSVHKTHGGWMRGLRETCDIYAYHVDTKTDGVTAQIRGYTTAFRHFPFDFEATRRSLAEDRLHVLIYLDIGMHPWTAQLAALRLAPVQCATWGQPVTSGLPAVDYYLSSDLMEPPDGASHYSEELIRLPGNGIYYEEPAVPRGHLTRTRRDFGLRDDAVVYLCCQSLYKYLPRHDALIAEIARRVPGAQFAFLGPNRPLAVRFLERMERAFAARGVEFAGRCVALPRLDTHSYWNLNLLSDVFLDSLVWSGCNTTLEAIACGLPVVTTPGSFMRGRHTYAMLTAMGVTETIAPDEECYIELAVRLGSDAAWRSQVAARMEQQRGCLYADRNCIQGLEDFIRDAVERCART